MNDTMESVLPESTKSPRRWSIRHGLLVSMVVVLTGVLCAQHYSSWRNSETENTSTAVTSPNNTVQGMAGAINTEAHAIIRTSLYAAVSNAGFNPSLAIKLRDIFGGRVDFRHAIRPGDWFTVIYGAGTRNIIAAELSIQGHVYRAFRFQDGKDGDRYFTTTGQSLHQSIMRAPLDYSFISSRFSYHRLDPILHVIRPHYGVDYAAPMGTPVKAAADGRIRFLGVSPGYGNLIVISSFGKYETYYAHLHRFAAGLHDGSTVKQGHVIGYVGESGEATGPHLHFGIRVDGVWRNPLTVPLPDAKPLPKVELTAFRQHIAPLLAEFNGFGVRPIQTASAGSGAQDNRTNAVTGAPTTVGVSR
jgi:murein DD-endopeptidase MepM/ murein hydrolase activator NlpD